MSCPLLELLPGANILSNGSVTTCFEDDRLQLLLFCPGDPRHTRSIVDLGCIPSLLSDLPQASCPLCLLDLFFVLQRSHFHPRSSGSWPLRREHRNFATVIASLPPWPGGPDFALPNDIPNPRSVAISPSILGLDFSIRWASMVSRSSRFSRRSFAFWSSWAALTRPAIFESTAIDLSSTTANQNSTWSKWTSLRALTNSSSNKGRERILLSDPSILKILRQKDSTDHWDSEADQRPSVKSRSRDLGSWPDRRLDRQQCWTTNDRRFNVKVEPCKI